MAYKLHRKLAGLLIGFGTMAALTLSGCGGGGSSGDTTATTLSGTAAVGYPIVGGAVNVVCAAGAPVTSTTTGSTGAWSVTLSGQTLPCEVQVTGGTVNGGANTTPYHSVAVSLGTVNVTPLTDLLVANLTGTATPATVFASLSTNPAQLTLTQTDIDAALAQLRTALGLTQFNTINPVTLAFNATPGVVMDDILSAFQTAMTNAAVSYATLLNNASAPTFTVPAGFGAILSTAYAGTPSGSGGGGAVTCDTAQYVAGAVRVPTTNELAGYAATYTGSEGTYGPNPGDPFVPSGSATLVFAANGSATYNSGALTVTSICLDQAAPVLYVMAGVTHFDLFSNGDLYGVAPNGNVVDPAAYAGGGGGGGTQMGGAKQGTPLNLSATVTTFAGAATQGTADGTGTAAQFNYPSGVATDGTNLYIADKFNHLIRKAVIATGAVTTLAGGAGQGTADGTGAAAQFNNPAGITTDGTSLFVVDELSCLVRKIDIASAAVTTLAGGLCGYGDGTGAVARFNLPVAITTDGTNLYVADTNSQTIRQIVIATGVVTTLAGTQYAIAATDATGLAARFNYPAGITTDGTSLYVADNGNHSIRKIVIATGAVTTLAGTSASSGSTDGTGAAALFKNPYGITTDGTNLYVADSNNYTIRKVVIATGAVTTVAGSAGSFGLVNGIGSAAQFQVPNGITTDGSSLFVAVTNGNIRQIQ